MRGPGERLILGTRLFPFGTGCESVPLEILRIGKILRYRILRSEYGSGYSCYAIGYAEQVRGHCSCWIYGLSGYI
jgi:hypothetical protein